MSKIIINNMNFHYVEYFNPVFEGVNLTLDTDWCLGLIGRNGRGKTTFLKLLKGELEPDSGVIGKSVVMEYFPYECRTDYEETLDVLKELIGGLKRMEDAMERLLLEPADENLARYGEIQEKYQEADGYEMEGRIQKEFYLMGLPEEILRRDFKVLSGGERTKVLLIALFLRPNTFVLMDEPTNHLDLPGKQAVAAYLKQKKGFMVVSHDRHFLDQVTDHILAINKCDITLEKGNYTTWKENVEKKETFEFRTKTNLEKEIADLERGAVVRRNWAEIAEKEKNPYKTNNRGNSSRAAKFMRQAKNAEQEVREDIAHKKELLKNYETVPALCSFGQETDKEAEENRILAQINKLTFRYGELPLFQDFSLRIDKGDRVWIRGGNGSGKSTLLKIISGELETEYLHFPERVKIAQAFQEPLWQEGYAREKVTDPVWWEKFLMLCNCLDITGEMLERPIQTYSSGEKNKIDIARALSEENEILLLDEPLNYMDVYFREQLEKAILTLQPTLIFVEHDERFGNRVATRTINIHQEENSYGKK